jgi:hypothetical protein
MDALPTGRAARGGTAARAGSGMAAAAGLAGLALLLAACGSGGSPSGTAAPASSAASSSAAPSSSAPSASASPTATTGSEKLADGTTRVTDAELGYQLTLPKGYTRITSKDQLAEIAKAGSKALKKQSAALSAAAFAQNVKLFAVNRLTGGTINLVEVPAAGSTSADLASQGSQIEEVLTSQLGAKEVTSRSITVDGDPGLRADGTVNTTGVKVRLTQIYAVHGDNVFITTIGGAASTPEKTIAAVIAGEHFTG